MVSIVSRRDSTMLQEDFPSRLEVVVFRCAAGIAACLVVHAHAQPRYVISWMVDIEQQTVDTAPVFPWVGGTELCFCQAQVESCRTAALRCLRLVHRYRPQRAARQRRSVKVIQDDYRRCCHANSGTSKRRNVIAGLQTDRQLHERPKAFRRGCKWTG